MAHMKPFYTDESLSCASLPEPELLALAPVATDLAITNQRTVAWRGFGACFNELGWRALGHLAAEERARLLDAFFAPDGQQRFRFCRLPIGANDYSFDWYSHSETPDDFAMEHHSIARDQRALLPYLREALARQSKLELFASPWSPPVWLKSPPVHNFGTLIADERHLDAYARYFVKFVQAYSIEGIRIAQVHVQNEPMSSQKFPSCVVTGEEFARFIGQHLGPAFREAGLSTEIWLGTLNGPETDGRKFTTSFNDYAFTVMQDPTAAAHIKGVSYQWAGKYALPRQRLAYPDLPIIQSENECGDGTNTWQHAWYVADLVQHYLSHDACAYVYWNPVLEPGGFSTWGWPQNAMVTVDPVTRAAVRNPEFHLFQHFAASIPVGARRLECARPWSSNALAYETAEGAAAVVVRNPFTTARPISVTRAGRAWRLTLPARALVTFHLP